MLRIERFCAALPAVLALAVLAGSPRPCAAGSGGHTEALGPASNSAAPVGQNVASGLPAELSAEADGEERRDEGAPLASPGPRTRARGFALRPWSFRGSIRTPHRSGYLASPPRAPPVLSG